MPPTNDLRAAGAEPMIEDDLYASKRREYEKLSDAKLVKKIRHLNRTIARGIRTGFLQRNIDVLDRFLRIALETAAARASQEKP